MKIFAQTTNEELQTMHGFSHLKYEELRESRSIIDVPDGTIIVILDEIPLEKLQTMNIFQPSIN
jgi:hypothetical protein